jgi:RHS repeat-associated protein
MELLRTYYHPDHLGSSSTSTELSNHTLTELSNHWITDGSGNAIQHLHYLPFGEDWVDQRNSTWNAPYTFSGKEKDMETGYGYFGARYYDSGLSIWLSVDPMSDKYPSMSPYNYCANNPVILVDPDGKKFIEGNDIINWFIENSNSIIKNYNNQLTKLNSWTPKTFIGRRIKDNQINKIEEWKKECETALCEVEEMSKSDVQYSLIIGGQYDSVNGTTEVGGYTKSEGEEHIITMYVKDRNDIGTIAHELKHGYQFENRELSFNVNGSIGVWYDMCDEIEAYYRGAAYGGPKYSRQQIEIMYKKQAKYTDNKTNYGINNSVSSIRRIFDQQGEIYHK